MYPNKKGSELAEWRDVLVAAATAALGLGLALGCTRARTPAAAEGRPASAAAPSIEQSRTAAPAAADPRRTRQRCQPDSCDYQTQACCEDELSSAMSGCVNKDSAPADQRDSGQRCPTLPRSWIGIECLTSSDCADGVRCCHAESEGGGLNYCALQCTDHEACMPTAPDGCHSGSRCEARPDTRSGGSCVVAEPSTACGQVRCSGETPGCRFDLRTGVGQCSALEHGSWPSSAFQSDGGLALLQCASPKDCAGERCCIGGPLAMTSCAGSCTSGIDVCDTVADCPKFVGPAIGCKPDPDGPPFVKLCQYAWHTP